MGSRLDFGFKCGPKCPLERDTLKKDCYKMWHIYCQKHAFGCNLFFVREILSQRKASKWLQLFASVAGVITLFGVNQKKAIGIYQIQSLFKHLMAIT
jgi:hypothetical protein